jgi:hypothetical protein
MSVAAQASATPATIDLVGMWRLIAVTGWKDGEMRNPHAMGNPPAGYITYTPEGRMLVVLDRREVARDRYGADPIFSYCGRYTRNGDVVTHHLELCTAIKDIGTDYVRHIEVAGDHLFLCTPPVHKDGHTYVTKLEWAPDTGA